MYYNFNIKRQKDPSNLPYFDIRSVNQASYDVNWHSVMHYHDFTEIIFILNGEGHMQTNFGTQPVQKNSLVIINPFIEHTEHSSIENPMKYVVIGFKGPEIIFPNQMRENDLIIFNDDSFAFRSLFSQIIKESAKHQQYTNQIIEHLVNAVIFSIINEANTDLDNQHKNLLSPSVTLAKNYIDNNYSKKITLETLESRSHISKYHLSHLFKEELGISPINYLQDLRFKHALNLLETTNHSIIQIAEMVGFYSSNYFSNKFKERYHVSPLQYRKQHQNQSAALSIG